jgi:hypothetical protein
LLTLDQIEAGAVIRRATRAAARNLLAAAARGIATDEILREVEAEGQREQTLEREMAQLEREKRAADQSTLTHELQNRVADVRGLLGRHVGQTRQILRRLLVKKLKCEPFEEGDRRGYRITGERSYAELLPPGIHSEYPVTPAGTTTLGPRPVSGLVLVA